MEIVGHQKIWQFLKKSAALNRISHAYLFSGEEKLGKKKIAMEFIKLLGCEIKNNQHPDFLLVEPESGKIQISQVRELIRKLSLKPYSAPFKSAIIDKAHLMTTDSQNCFLKMLEEPKGNTVLILLSENPDILLPTILSRVETIKFHPVSESKIENYLTKNLSIPIAKAKEISAISMGRPGRAIEFALHPEKLEDYRRKINDLAELILKSDLSFRFKYAQLMSQSNPGEVLNVWLFYLRNLLLDQISSKTPGSINYPLPKLMQILEKVQNTNYLISTTNVNARLALENLMLSL